MEGPPTTVLDDGWSPADQRLAGAQMQLDALEQHLKVAEGRRLRAEATVRTLSETVATLQAGQPAPLESERYRMRIADLEAAAWKTQGRLLAMEHVVEQLASDAVARAAPPLRPRRGDAETQTDREEATEVHTRSQRALKMAQEALRSTWLTA